MLWVELGWEEFKGVERGMAGIPALTKLFIDSRLLQEFRSVSWLPKEPNKSYELQDLQKTIAKENHRALRVFCRFLNLCTSILQLVRALLYCEPFLQPELSRVPAFSWLPWDPCSATLASIPGQMDQQKLSKDWDPNVP